jgi:osmoprotectant transport system ATP-binding protein
MRSARQSPAGKTALVVLNDVSKTFGSRVALYPVSLTFPARRATVLIGPSGCGKSTLIRMIVGLVRPDSGSVAVDGVTLSAVNIDRVRHAIGYVIQDGGLFPHLTVEENVTLLATHLGRDRAWMSERIRALAELTDIPHDLLARYPQQLSGGQRQRVGLMRALMLDPPVLLLDEPLGALDPVTRYELQTELKAIFERLEKTVVMVTHDMGEAAYFADELVMMRDGRVVQRGPLADLLERPSEPYVHEFIRAQRMPVPAARV